MMGILGDRILLSTLLDRSFLEIRAINQWSVVHFPSVLFLLIILAWSVSLSDLGSLILGQPLFMDSELG